MSLSMYQASVPVLTRALTNLIAVLEKGAAYAEAKKIDPSVLLNYRLAADMFPLTRQVQIATDMSKGCVARLAGVEIPKYDDTEASFPELIARLRKTIDFVNSFSAAQIDGSEDKTITLQRKDGEVTYKGQPYLLFYVHPHVYFHCTTAYAILRHIGVDIGKKDFIGQL
ncbi:MAG: DUF1993 domain-containing protein [Pseudomonadota bacterium]